MNRIIKRMFFVVIALSGILLLITSSPSSVDSPIDINFMESGCIIHHDGTRYLTCKPLPIKINRDIVTIPDEFETDFNIIPQWYWSMFLHLKGAHEIAFPIVLHSYLYECPGNVPRETIDVIFYYALLKNDVSKFNAYKFWLGAKLFGSSMFNSGRHCNRNDYVDDNYEAEIGYSGDT